MHISRLKQPEHLLPICNTLPRINAVQHASVSDLKQSLRNVPRAAKDLINRGQVEQARHMCEQALAATWPGHLYVWNVRLRASASAQDARRVLARLHEAAVAPDEATHVTYVSKLVHYQAHEDAYKYVMAGLSAGNPTYGRAAGLLTGQIQLGAHQLELLFLLMRHVGAEVTPGQYKQLCARFLREGHRGMLHRCAVAAHRDGIRLDVEVYDALVNHQHTRGDWASALQAFELGRAAGALPSGRAFAQAFDAALKTAEPWLANAILQAMRRANRRVPAAMYEMLICAFAEHPGQPADVSAYCLALMTEAVREGAIPGVIAWNVLLTQQLATPQLFADAYKTMLDVGVKPDGHTGVLLSLAIGKAERDVLAELV